MSPILFLDFDGVLHPGDVYMAPGRQPWLEGDGALFMWMPILEEILADFPAVRIVLSTNWVGRLRFQPTKAYLSPALQRRVIGATYHSHIRWWFQYASRHDQIARYLTWKPYPHWIALDDLHEGDEIGQWPEAERDRLVLVDAGKGISDPAAQAALRAAFEGWQ